MIQVTASVTKLLNCKLLYSLRASWYSCGNKFCCYVLFSCIVTCIQKFGHLAQEDLQAWLANHCLWIWFLLGVNIQNYWVDLFVSSLFFSFFFFSFLRQVITTHFKLPMFQTWLEIIWLNCAFIGHSYFSDSVHHNLIWSYTIKWRNWKCIFNM